MVIDRRSALRGVIGAGAGMALARSAHAAIAASPEPQQRGDALNPPGIRANGIRMLPVVGGRYKVWTRRIGRGEVKVLLLHGGPGMGHEYLEAMEAFLPQAGCEIYQYDQLGTNNSDRPDDPSLWTLPRYLDEVEEVRQGLGLDDFVLLGHSWGGILAIEYALAHGNRLRGLVISNMAAGMTAYLRYTNALKRALLSPASLATLDRLERSGAYDDPAYQRLMMDELYPQMLCRLKPWPEPVTRTLRHVNTAIYEQMQGASEFQVTGNLKNWERWDRLHAIAVPSLTIGAVHDEMDPRDMVRMARLMPNGRSHICPNGSHLAMWDDQQSYFGALLAFLATLGPVSPTIV